jgi:glycosyltransferase involved in cell wall biosynthesis
MIYVNRNKGYFDRLMSQALQADKAVNFEGTMIWAKRAGFSGWYAHPGFYAQADLEKLLHRIGHFLSNTPPTGNWQLPKSNQDGRRFLHVMSTAYFIGGHTRLAARWIEAGLPDERHSLILLDQGTLPVPDWLKNAALSKRGEFINLTNLSFMDRAAILRHIANAWADIVVLHTHPDDPIPSVAFGVAGGPPVILLNHADHNFWLGSGIADVTADLRLAGQNLSLSRRRIRHSEILPIPLDPKSLSLTTEQYKRKLGIPENKVVLLTCGRPQKYIPHGSLNFPEIMAEVVREHPNCVLLVVGPNKDEIQWKTAIIKTNQQIRVLGLQTNTEDYYGAADIFIESFPEGSLTATLEAAQLGKTVVRSPSPLAPIFVLDRYQGMDENASDLNAFKQQLAKYIADPHLRLNAGRIQQSAVINTHIGTGWRNYLRRLIDSLPPKHDVEFGSPDIGTQAYDHIWAEMQEQIGFSYAAKHLVDTTAPWP